MSYIAFDLDALNVCPDVAAASGLTSPEVAYGLLRLWAWCFREETETVTDVHLRGFLGGKDAGAALAAFGFLERQETGWRVRGASRYLRIKEAQRSAAKRTNDRKRSAEPSGETPQVDRRSTDATPTVDRAVEARPYTEHRRPTTDDRTPNGFAGGSPAPDVLFAFEHLKARAPKRKAKPRDPDADPRHKPLVDALVAAGAPFTGGRDAKRVSELLALGGQACDVDSAPAEVLARWQRALRHQGYPTVRSLSELVTHWGHFGAPPSDLPAWSEVEGSREVAF